MSLAVTRRWPSLMCNMWRVMCVAGGLPARHSWRDRLQRLTAVAALHLHSAILGTVLPPCHITCFVPDRTRTNSHIIASVFLPFQTSCLYHR